MDKNEKIVIWTFFVFGILVWFLLGRFFAEMMTVFGIVDPLWNTFLKDVLPVSSIIGFVFAVALTFFIVKSEKAREWGVNVVSELKKVTWPTKPEIKAATVIVIVFVAVLTVILASFDYIWGGITSLIFKV